MSCLYFCMGDESKTKMERHFMLGDPKTCKLEWSQCCWDVCSGAAVADCLSPPLGWPLASTMCLLVVHCPRTLLSKSSHAVVLDAQGLPALMAILPRLCSSGSDRYLRMSFGRCSEESIVPLEMLFPQRRCSQFFPSNHD